MKKETSFLDRWDAKLDAVGDSLKDKQITFPTEMVGAAVFLVLAAVILVIMPKQVAVSEADVVNGRVFPTMLMILIAVCSGILLLQGFMKMAKKEPVAMTTLNLLTEVKALIIMGILLVTYLICRVTDLFVAGSVFCALAFLLYFRCRKKSYYAITIGMAVLIWVAFRFGLGVRF